MSTKQNAPEVCQECGAAHPRYDLRDMVVSRRGLKKTVHNVAGWFCDGCEEIEFDQSTDSLQRWAAAGDELVLKSRELAKKRGEMLREQRNALSLTQVQAGLLTGGGHNAFSRYERGTATPVVAVSALFGLLAAHPELVQEAQAIAAQFNEQSSEQYAYG